MERARRHRPRSRPADSRFSSLSIWQQADRRTLIQTEINPMTKRLIMAVAAVLTLLQAPAWSQNWPTRSITLVVPFPAGSATDTIGRLVADRLSKRLGRSVVVDNRVGGGSLVGTASVARSEPDGYTLLFGTNSALVILPLTQRASMTFDPVRDLSPIGIVAALPNILIVSPKLPVSSVRELIQHAKANPGKLSVRVQRVRNDNPPDRRAVQIPRRDRCRPCPLQSWRAGRPRPDGRTNGLPFR